MKTYDETIAAVLGRMELYEKKKKQRRTVCAKAAAGVGGLCLAVLLGLGMQQGNTPEGPGGTHSPAEDKVVVCSLEDDMTRVKMDIALMLDDFVEMTLEEMVVYYGVDVVPQTPADLKVWEEQRFGIFRRSGGADEVYWDGNVLNFSNEEGGRAVNLEVWKDRGSISCYVFFAFVEERSVINGVEVALALSEGGYYHAEFTRGGVGFRLIATGLSQEEVVEVIRSLTQ